MSHLVYSLMGMDPRPHANYINTLPAELHLQTSGRFLTGPAALVFWHIWLRNPSPNMENEHTSITLKKSASGTRPDGNEKLHLFLTLLFREEWQEKRLNFQTQGSYANHVSIHQAHHSPVRTRRSCWLWNRLGPQGADPAGTCRIRAVMEN